MSKVEVGSKWVCTVDEPFHADVYKGNMVIIDRVTDLGTVYYTNMRTGEDRWVAGVEDFGEGCVFVPFVEKSKSDSAWQPIETLPENYKKSSEIFLVKDHLGIIVVARYLHRWGEEEGILVVDWDNGTFDKVAYWAPIPD